MSVTIVNLPMADFPPVHEAWSAVLALIGAPAMVSVPRLPEYPPGGCYSHTALQSKRLGGRPVYGWMIEWLPGVYVQAMHHAIWQPPNGSRRDITQPQNRPSLPSAMTSFVPDDRFKPDKYGLAYHENRIVNLVEDADVLAAHAAYCVNNKALGEVKVLQREYAAGKVDPFRYSATHKRLNVTLDDSFKSLHEHRRAIKLRYFSAN